MRWSLPLSPASLSHPAPLSPPPSPSRPSQGLIQNSDLIFSFRSDGTEQRLLSETEMHLHATLVLEATLRPVLDSKTMSLSFKINLNVQSPTMFFESLIKHLESTGQGIEKLRRDAATLLLHAQHTAAVAPSPQVLHLATPQSLPPPGMGFHHHQRTWAQSLGATEPPQMVGAEGLAAAAASAEQPFVLSKFEASDPISKFLAMLRKNGMDLLFPISAQDKVLVSIYVAVRSPDSAPMAHRELIEMVIFAKNFKDLCDCESISKTKVRGGELKIDAFPCPPRTKTHPSPSLLSSSLLSQSWHF